MRIRLRMGKAPTLLLALLLLPVSAAGLTLAGLEIGDPVICNAVWDGGGDGSSWHDATNWEGDALPGADHSVCLNSGTVSVGGPVGVGSIHGGQLSVNGGTLALASTSETNSLAITGGTVTVGEALTVIESVSQTGGTVNGGGSIMVQGPWHWSGGVQSGTGSSYSFTLDLAGGSARSISTREVTATDIVFAADGSVRLADPEARLTALGDLTVNGHHAEILGDGRVSAGRIHVLGAGDNGGSLDIEPAYDTADTEDVLIEAGGLLRLGGTGTQQGDFTLTGDAQLVLDADQGFDEQSTLTASAESLLSVFGGTTHFGGTAQLGQLFNVAVLYFWSDASAADVTTFGRFVVQSSAVFDVHGPGGFVQGGLLEPGEEEDDATTPVTNVLGTLAVRNGGHLRLNQGRLEGSGTVAGPVINTAGTVAPDGVLRVAGAYTQELDGGLSIARRDLNWDRLAVEGTATLGGTLSLPWDGIVPSFNVDVLTTSNRVGKFFLTTGEVLTCGEVTYTDTAVTMTPASCVAVADATASEGAGTIKFPVVLTKSSDAPVAVSWSTADGTAQAGSDFTGGTGTLTVPPGQTEASIDIALINDETHEDDETFTLNLSSTGGQLSSTNALGTLTDDDEAPLRLEVRDIIADVNSASVVGVGNAHVVGFESPDADTIHSWGWRIDDGAFSYQHIVRYLDGINADDDVIGSCVKVGGGFAPCFRSAQVTTWLQPPASGGNVITYAVNRHDVIVGAIDDTGSSRALRWATPSSPAEPIGPNDPSTKATALSDSGYVGGSSTYGTGADRYTLGWVMDPNGLVTMIGPLTVHPEFRYMSVNVVAEDGTVYGYANDGYAAHNIGWKWSPAGGLVELGADSGIGDSNAVGQTVGTLDGVPTLIKADGKTLDLRTALVPGQDWTLLGVSDISDQGVIVGYARHPGSTTGHIVALVPPGAGCAVCVDLKATQPQYPDPLSSVPVEQSTIDGNEVTLSAVVRNETLEPRTVAVTFLDQDGQPLGNTRSVTLVAKSSSSELAALWHTDGLAWDAAGNPAPAHVVSVQVKDAARGDVRTYEKQIRVDPRPVIAVHGMMSGASTWSSYPQFLRGINPHWDVLAVDSMDTMPWYPNTIAQNAHAMSKFVDSRQEWLNAWHVDLVAHSMGGLVSRYYLQNLMPTLDGKGVVNQLVMLGTPNGGSPCADLFDVAMTKELREDDVARFNEDVTDHMGVPFSEAVGTHVPVTCDTTREGDDVVPADTAALGVDDVKRFDIAHTDMTGSEQLFKDFVLPRLNGRLAPIVTARPAGLAAQGVHAPQLLQIDPMTLGPNESTSIELTVPSSATSVGLGLAAAPQVRVEIIKGATTVVEMPAGGTDLVRSASFPAPVAGSYTLRFTNTSGEVVQTESSVWAAGLPMRVVARAEQVGDTGGTASLRLTATVEGEIPTGQTLASGTVNLADGSTVSVDLFDDGRHDDGAAGDNTYGTLIPDLGSGTYAASVFIVSPNLTVATTTSADIEFVEDLPGDQAPVVRSTTVQTSRDQAVNVGLRAIDPEGASVTYEILTQPSHGTLGGRLPALVYTPDVGYLGPDSFTWRASDGTQWSDSATVSVTVSRAATELVYEAPFPAEGTQGASIEARVRLAGPLLEPVSGVPVEFRLGEHTVTSQTVNGRAVATLPLDLPSGQYDLVMTFAGTDAWAPTTLTQKITVIGGSAPQPSMPDGASGEAGYLMRLRVSANDPDRDASRFQIDFTNDGTWDAESVPLSTSGVAWFDHTYPDEFEGSVRVRVTDGAGNSAEAVEPLHVAPHRPLGALSLVQVDGAPVDGVAVSDDGTTALVQMRDTEGQQALPRPYRLLDLATGQSQLASVLPDGSQADFPIAGAVSTDGRFVAFSVLETVSGEFAAQSYLRDMSTGKTVRVSVRPDGSTADGNTWPVDVSTDGRWVLVLSSAHGFTSDDVDRCQAGTACVEAYLLDTQTHAATLVSRGADGKPATQVSGSAAMTPDAGVVVATARNLVVTYERSTGGLSALPLSGTGDLPDVTGAASDLDLSDDGRYVLFTTAATGLVDSDTSDDLDVYRLDRATGSRVLVSVSSTGDGSQASATEAAMDGSGTRVSFASTATDLVAGESDPVKDVYLRDLGKGTTVRISQEARDGVAGQHDSLHPLLAGRALLFSSDAANLVPGDIDGERDLFRFQLDPASPPADPLAISLPSPVAVAEGGQVELTATAVGGSGDLTYTWHSDTGTITGSGSTVLLEAVDGPADGHVTATVSDGSTRAEATALVHVVNVAPTVDAGADVTVAWGKPVTLHATVDDVSPADVTAGLSPQWTFSDGTTANGADVNRTWTTPGTITAQVTVTDKDGASTSDTVKITVTKHASSLLIAATAGGFGLATVKAEVTEPDAGGIAGRPVVFTIDGEAQPAVVTDAAGTATVPASALMPGSHSVSATVAEDELYQGASANAMSVTVSNTPGKVTGSVLVAEGTASFGLRTEGNSVKGNLEWSNRSGSFKASLTALGVSLDGRSAWFAGTSGTHTILVYVEDNGESGVGDVFRLWVDGDLRTATGARTSGNVQIHTS